MAMSRWKMPAETTSKSMDGGISSKPCLCTRWRMRMSPLKRFVEVSQDDFVNFVCC